MTPQYFAARPGENITMSEADIVSVYAKRAHGKQGLVYAPSWDLAGRLREAFRLGGFEANCLTAKLDLRTRGWATEEFNLKHIKILIMVSIIPEEVEGVDVVMLVKTTACYERYVDQLKPVLGKDGLVIDFANNVETYGTID